MDKELLNISTSSIGSVLQDFGNEMQEALRQELRKKDINVSYELEQSIKFEAKIFGTQFRFTLELADYYDYINKGVSGTIKKYNTPYSRTKMPPESKIAQWMNNKGLFVPKGATVTSIASRKTFTAGSKASQLFALRKAMKEQGTKPNHFYDNVVTPQRLKQLQDDLSKAAKGDIETLVIGTAKGIFGINR